MGTLTFHPMTNRVVLFKIADSGMFTRPHSVATGFQFAFSTFHYSWRFQSPLSWNGITASWKEAFGLAGNVNTYSNSFSLMWILMSAPDLSRGYRS